jgi:hypothetical protein
VSPGATVWDVRAAPTQIGGPYTGEDRAAEFEARNGVPGELLIRLSIQACAYAFGCFIPICVE